MVPPFFARTFLSTVHRTPHKVSQPDLLDLLQLPHLPNGRVRPAARPELARSTTREAALSVATGAWILACASDKDGGFAG